MNKDTEGHGVLIHKDHYVTGAEFKTASSLKWESLRQLKRGLCFKFLFIMILMSLHLKP